MLREMLDRFRRTEGANDLQKAPPPAPVMSDSDPIPWPVPMPSGTKFFTFRGEGIGTSAEFTLPADGALRIASEKGPFQLQVCKADGTFLKDVASLPDGGLALLAIPQSGRYSLVIHAPARWGITVVYQE